MSQNFIGAIGGEGTTHAFPVNQGQVKVTGWRVPVGYRHIQKLANYNGRFSS
jgi:hypothetical protein